MPLYPPGSRVPIGNGPIERHSNDGVIGEFHDSRHTRQQPVGLGQVSSGARHAVLQLFGKLSHLLPGAPAFDDFLLELSVGRPQPSLRSAESSAPRTSSWLLGTRGGSSAAVVTEATAVMNLIAPENQYSGLPWAMMNAPNGREMATKDKPIAKSELRWSRTIAGFQR